MAKVKKSENILKEMEEKFETIDRLTDDFFKKFFNEEYVHIFCL